MPDVSLHESLDAQIRKIGQATGLDAVGVAGPETFDGTRADLDERKAAGLHGGMQFTYRNPARSTEPSKALADVRSIIVGARSYRRQTPPRPGESRPQARVARYAWHDHYADLRIGLTAIAELLREHGWQAKVLADDNALVDREAARRAGIGWYGKNSNLLLPGLGSWFVLGSVLTDAPLEPAREQPADGCGSCVRCIDGCPTEAIIAPGVLDARRCLAWLVQARGVFPREFRVALDDRLYGCDDCQEVCPPNRLVNRRSEAPPEQGQAWIDVLELLASSDEELLNRHGRWYVPGRDARYLRRNALIVLGNTGDARDPEVNATLSAALGSPDPLLRVHAIWAARRLGLGSLTEVLLSDDDPDVIAELASDPPPVKQP